MLTVIRTRLRQTGRIARALGLCALMLLASGVVPAAAPCFERGHRCANARCICKHTPASAVRAPCPCCPAGGAKVGVMHDLGPAVLPVLELSFARELAGDTGAAAATVDRSFLPAVPHPPPRATN